MYIEIIHDNKASVPVLYQGPQGPEGQPGPEGPEGPQGASIEGPKGDKILINVTATGVIQRRYSQEAEWEDIADISTIQPIVAISQSLQAALERIQALELNLGPLA